VKVENESDYFLKIKSESTVVKIASMNRQFKQGFEEGLEIIKARLSKK